jgi:hypothetical protein
MKFRVYIDTNHHRMDTNARPMFGEFATYCDALEAAKSLIADALGEIQADGITSEEMLKAFVTQDEIPFIIPDENTPPFDARDYARRCSEALYPSQ